MSVPSHPGAPSRARTRRRPARSRVLVMVTIAVLLALVGASCRQLDPNNRAGSVPGVTNGNLPLSYLASSTSGCAVYDEALTSLNAMVAAAAKAGVDLKPAGCYRDYAGQVATRNDWCNRGACQMAAVPGTSNHGWGKAVDFRDQGGELTFDSVGYQWMKTWAGFWGWIHPKDMEQGGSVPEAWHWEWVGDGGKMFPGEYFGIGNAPLAVPRGVPFGYLDTAVGVEGAVTVTGWAIDPDQVGSIPVHIYVDGASYGLTADKSRPDVNAVFPLYAKASHGFSATVAATPGLHTVCAWAINMAGAGYNRVLGCLPVIVPPGAGPAAVPAGVPPPVAPAAVGPVASTTTSTTSTTMPTTGSTTTTTTTATTVGPPTTGSSVPPSTVSTVGPVQAGASAIR